MTANSGQTPLTFIYSGRATTSSSDMGKHISTATAFLTTASNSEHQQQFSSSNVEAKNEFAPLTTNNSGAHLNSLFAPANIKPTTTMMTMLVGGGSSVKSEGEELDEGLVRLEQRGLAEGDHNNEEDVEMATVCLTRRGFNLGKCLS